jgi:virginiamycin B lyase
VKIPVTRRAGLILVGSAVLLVATVIAIISLSRLPSTRLGPKSLASPSGAPTRGVSPNILPMPLTLPTLPKQGNVRTYAIPTPNSGILGISSDSAGDMWFTESGSGVVGRIGLDGTVREVANVGSDSLPGQITRGPDGNMWFVEEGSSRIGRVALAGEMVEYSLPPGARPSGITAGPDGATWFTENQGNAIGRIDPNGNIREYPIPTPHSSPTHITLGADGNLWFINSASARLGRCTPLGTFTEWPIPPPPLGLRPSGVAAAGGAIWLGAGPGALDRFTAASGFQTMQLQGIHQIVSLTAGVDGTIFFAEALGHYGLVSPAGAIGEREMPDKTSDGGAAAIGPQGSYWFTEVQANRVVSVQR